jgi:hypothetical protein
LRAGGVADPSHEQMQSQLPRPVAPVGTRGGGPNYFPASPRYAKTQPSSTALLEWNKPAVSQRMISQCSTQRQPANRSVAEIPATPSNNLPLRNPRPLAFTSTPRSGMGTTTAVPGSGRFHQSVSGSHLNVGDGLRSFSGAKASVAGLRRSLDGADLKLSRPLGRTECSSA